jgi:hypothetical protein
MLDTIENYRKFLQTDCYIVSIWSFKEPSFLTEHDTNSPKIVCCVLTLLRRKTAAYTSSYKVETEVYMVTLKKSSKLIAK